jgi:folate-binding protein YgfZ
MPGADIPNNVILSYLETLGLNNISSNGSGLFTQFADTAAELESLNSGVGLRLFTSPGVIELRGKDVLDYLHRISTNSLKELPKESIAFTIFTNEKGRIIDKSAVINFGDYQLLVTSPGNRHKVISWINKYVITDDVKAVDAAGKYFLFELIGPQADSYSTLLCGDAACRLNANTFRVINTEGILFFIMKVQDIKGPVKYWMLADPDNGLKLLKFMVDNKGPFDFNLTGEEAYNIFRVENGIPGAPNELNDQYNPHEAGIIELVNFTKGCYIGQEVIARLDTYNKVQRWLCGIKFNGEPPAAAGYLLTGKDGSEAGNITSLVNSRKLRSHIALGYVRKAFAEPGTELNAVSGDGQSFNVTVSELPFRR